MRTPAPAPEPTAPDRRALKFTLETIAVMAALAAQSCGVIWWAAGIDHRLGAVERVIAPLSDGSMRDTLSRVDERTSSMQRRSDRTGDKLDKLELELVSQARPK